MMMNKNESYQGFILYRSFYEWFKCSSPEEVKEMIMSLYQYCYSDEPLEFSDPKIEATFSIFKALIDKQIEKYLSSSKGGKNKKQKSPEELSDRIKENRYNNLPFG